MRARPVLRGTLALLSLALIGCLGLGAVQTAVHSVHHLAEPDEARQCSVLALAQHLEASAPDPLPTVAPRLVAPRAVVVAPPVAPPLPAFRPDEGRAPPPPATV